MNELKVLDAFEFTSGFARPHGPLLVTLISNCDCLRSSLKDSALGVVFFQKLVESLRAAFLF